MAERKNPWKLSPREMQMCDLLVVHGGMKPVAYALKTISIRTVEAYLTDAKKKAGVSTLVQLAVAHDRIQRGAA